MNLLCSGCTLERNSKQQANCNQSSGILSINPLWSVPQITFLLTEDPNYATGRMRMRRRRRSNEPLSPDRFSLYSSLSSLSGGLTIFTTDSDIHKVSAIVEDNTAVDKVHLYNSQDNKNNFHMINTNTNHSRSLYRIYVLFWTRKGREKQTRSHAKFSNCNQKSFCRSYVVVSKEGTCRGQTLHPLFFSLSFAGDPPPCGKWSGVDVCSFFQSWQLSKEGHHTHHRHHGWVYPHQSIR